MFAYIGGFFGLFKAVGYVLIKHFAEKSFGNSIFSALYQVEEDCDVLEINNLVIEDENNFKQKAVYPKPKNNNQMHTKDSKLFRINDYSQNRMNEEDKSCSENNSNLGF